MKKKICFFNCINIVNRFALTSFLGDKTGNKLGNAIYRKK